MIDLDEIQFTDEVDIFADRIPVEDIVVCHTAVSDTICASLSVPYGVLKHTISAQSVIKTQRFVAECIGFPYETDRTALQDYIHVHWAWCERKDKAARSATHNDTIKDSFNDTTQIINRKE